MRVDLITNFPSRSSAKNFCGKILYIGVSGLRYSPKNPPVFDGMLCIYLLYCTQPRGAWRVHIDIFASSKPSAKTHGLLAFSLEVRPIMEIWNREELYEKRGNNRWLKVARKYSLSAVRIGVSRVVVKGKCSRRRHSQLARTRADLKSGRSRAGAWSDGQPRAARCGRCNAQHSTAACDR